MTPNTGSILKICVAMGLAAAVHAGAFALALRTAERPGAVSRETGSISLNLIETLVLQTPAETETSKTAVATAEPVPEPLPAELPKTTPLDGKDKAETGEALQRKTRRDTDKDALRPSENSAPAPTDRDKSYSDKHETNIKKTTALTVRPKDEIKPGLPKPAPRKANKRPSEKKPPRKKGARSAPSRGTSLTSRANGRISASRGQLRNYGALVRAQVARKRPGSQRIRGTVIVGFAISKSGGLRYARINRSSGSKVLDRAALTAIRRAAPFPNPPKEMTLRQLSYRLPFRFK